MECEAKFRKDLSMPGMPAETRRCFEGVASAVPGRGLNLADCLMSGLAVFSLARSGGALKDFEWRDGRCLLSVDGMGH